MKFENSSALIIGGAGGFGMATARRLANRDMRVVIADVADERGMALAKELGNGSVYVRTDITDEASMQNAVDAAANIGPLRAAVIVHGSPPPPEPGGRTVSKDGKRASLVAFNHVVQMYLNAAYAITAMSAEAMNKNEPLESNQRGVIINTGSIAGFEGLPGAVSYSAAKAGIIGMTLALARDLSVSHARRKPPDFSRVLASAIDSGNSLYPRESETA